MSWYVDTAIAAAAFGAVTGPLVPRLIARIPEPVDDADEVDQADTAVPEELGQTLSEVPEADAVVEEPKELYVSIAAIPGLGLRSSIAGAVVGALLGLRLGWDTALLPWLFLVPVGIALAVVDWRTRLLPTKVIAPSYFVVIGLCLVGALIDGGTDDLVRAGWGWVVGGGVFLLLWLVYPRGLGYGDVRLSGVLGIALGFVGWGALAVGLFAGFFLGGIGGALLSALRIVERKAYPFGPFMLVGALVGVLWGERIADWYVGRL